MISNKKILVVGAGGFIGGHLVKKLLEHKNSIVAVDIKPKEYWFQDYENVNNHYSTDMKEINNCRKVTKNIDYVFNMACNMGGMGFIENNKAECMQSVLINTNLLIACKEEGIKRYFFSSSACAYNKTKQKDIFVEGLKENTDAYPADPEDGYGWEKLFSERMCRHFYEDFGLETRVARYHNVYGPLGTYDGGREKAPAALCRKVIFAKINKKNFIDIWGDGEQTRSFLYITDCIEGTKKLFESDEREVFNIGSEEQVSINQMSSIIENIAEIKLEKNYQLDKPKGVRGRSSNNSLIREKINWDSKTTLRDGLKLTYDWIYSQMISRPNNDKFSRKY